MSEHVPPPEPHGGPLYPEVTVPLSDLEGNAFVLIGVTMRQLRRGGVERSEIERFQAAAASGDFDHVLQTIMAWVETT